MGIYIYSPYDSLYIVAYIDDLIGKLQVVEYSLEVAAEIQELQELQVMILREQINALI